MGSLLLFGVYIASLTAILQLQSACASNLMQLSHTEKSHNRPIEQAANILSSSRSNHLTQQIREQPQDTEALVGAQIVVLQCRFEGAIGTPSWTRNGLLLLRNYSSFAGTRFSVITNSSTHFRTFDLYNKKFL